MIRRFLRPGTTSADLTSITPVAVLASGGGFAGWSSSHPTCRLLFDFVPCVYSLVLPYHGPLSSQPYDRTKEDIIASIETVRTLLSPLVSSRYVLYLGYSMGSLYLLKLIPHLPSHPSSPLIAIGSALTLTTSAPGIEDWWVRLAREDTARLVRTHGESYPTMINFIIDTCARVDSPLLPDKKQREEAVKKMEVYWVAGEDDVAFPLAELQEAVRVSGDEGEGRRQRVWVVKSQHFNFFKEDTWPLVDTAVRDIIHRHARLELLQPGKESEQIALPSAL